MDVRNSTGSTLTDWNWTKSCEEVQNKIIKSKSISNPFKQKLWNPNPSCYWNAAGF